MRLPSPISKNSRRPIASSGARKSRNNITLSVKIIAFLFFLAITIIILDTSGGSISSSFDSARRSVRNLFSGAVSAIVSPVTSFRSFIDPYFNYAHLASENNLLKRQSQYIEWQSEINRLTIENRSLRRMLTLDEEISAKYLANISNSTVAKVISYGSNDFNHSLIIDKGSDDGVSLNYVAIDEKGLVGRVIEVDSNTSLVLLVADIASRIPVETISSGLLGIAGGNNRKSPIIDYINIAGLIEGEEVVTSGHGGIFSAGIPVGKIIIEENAAKIDTYSNKFNLGWLRLIPSAEDIKEKKN